MTTPTDPEVTAEFKLDREQGERPLPIATAHDIHGAKLLDVQAVETNARPLHAPNAVYEQRRRGLLARLLGRR